MDNQSKVTVKLSREDGVKDMEFEVSFFMSIEDLERLLEQAKALKALKG